MVKDCTVRGVEKPCSELFKDNNIDLGHCCSFNILPELLVNGGDRDNMMEHLPEYEWNPQVGDCN